MKAYQPLPTGKMCTLIQGFRFVQTFVVRDPSASADCLKAFVTQKMWSRNWLLSILLIPTGGLFVNGKPMRVTQRMTFQNANFESSLSPRKFLHQRLCKFRLCRQLVGAPSSCLACLLIRTASDYRQYLFRFIQVRKYISIGSYI